MPADKVAEYADGLCYTDLMAGYYLGAPDEVLQAIADYSAWFFVWDDRHDRDIVHRRPRAWRRLRFRLHAALDSPGGASAPRGSAGRRVRRQRGAAVLVPAPYVEHPVRPALPRGDRGLRPGIPQSHQGNHSRRSSEYLALRRLTFAHWIWTDLLEPCAGRELPDRIRKHPAYRRAALLSQEFAAWYNDLCSLPKEIAGDEVHNLGISLINTRG